MDCSGVTQVDQNQLALQTYKIQLYNFLYKG